MLPVRPKEYEAVSARERDRSCAPCERALEKILGMSVEPRASSALYHVPSGGMRHDVYQPYPAPRPNSPQLPCFAHDGLTGRPKRS